MAPQSVFSVRDRVSGGAPQRSQAPTILMEASGQKYRGGALAACLVFASPSEPRDTLKPQETFSQR